MRLRARRRNLVIWSPSAGPDNGYGATRLTRFTRTQRIRRRIRIAALLTLIGLRPRWRPALAGVVFTAVGVALRSGIWGALIVPGLWFLLYAVLIPAIPEADRIRRTELRRELAVYSTPAQRCDLEATLDRYPDGITRELRDILAGQAPVACNRIPGAGQY
jgi:hypothetical protein